MDVFNNTTKVVKDDLVEKITSGSRVSIAAACFSIYAFQALEKQLRSVESLRFIFTSPTFIAEKTKKERREFYIPRLKREKSLYGTEFEVRLRNELKQKAVAKECADWIRKKATFKTNTTYETISNYIVVKNEDDLYAYNPINDFTTVGIGCERGNVRNTLIMRAENPESQMFLQSFNEVWNDSERMQDVTADVVDMISTVYQENAPELIYFMTLYNIFNEFLEDISEDVLPNEATGFKNSVIWNKLYNFQKDAALGIINKLEQYNGCILADSVGLGKKVLSAETGTKHGLNVSGLIFDEIHAQPNRKLYDVLTKGSGDAREQPLFFIITTAGNDKNSICYELHTKALDIMNGRKKDTTFYPVVYGLTEEDDWTDEANWYRANPSLGYTIQIDRVREAFKNAMENPAEENVFKQLRLNIWTSASIRWIPEHIYDKGNLPIDLDSLRGHMCYGGLDLSSTSDITALVLAFPPRTEDEKYIILPFFWLPEDTFELRCRRDHVLYDVWKRQGYIQTTEGNVIHYGFIEKFIEDLGKIYNIREIAFDRWNATQMVQNLEDMGFTVVPFGQGYKDMSPPSKELYKLLMEGNIIHGGNPVLKWMAGNVVMKQDPAGNIKPDKEKSVEKIDGIVATIMALDRCIRNDNGGSVYDERDMIVF